MILSLDQSLTDTGYCLYDNGEYTYGNISNKKLDGMARLNFIVESIEALLRPYASTCVIIEGYAFGVSVGSRCFDLGELGGIIKYHLFTRGTPFVVIPPTSMKKFITSTGNCKKELLLKEVYKRYGVDFDNNNIADAFGLMKTYQGLLQYCKLGDFDMKLTKTQEEVCEKLKPSITEILQTIFSQNI